MPRTRNVPVVLTLALLLAASAAAGGCTSEAEFRYSTDVDPGEQETPPPPGLDTGDGHDGALTVSAPLVVNTCAAVAQAGGTSIALAAPAAFAPATGTRLILLQVADEFAVLGSGDPIESAGRAGRFALARAVGADGTTVSVESPLPSAFGGGDGAVQVCTIPEYTDVTVDAAGRIDAVPWDGRSGGVAAFLANGTVAIDGAVSADAAGFRGGAASQAGTDDTVTALSTSVSDGGGKGEGLDRAGWIHHGRGAFATGAGGGNSSRAGGGGGGNFGAGGFGGFDATATADTRGQGGASLDAAGELRLTLGGGGGGGHQVPAGGELGGAGGAGGGIVFVVVRSLAGGGSLSADGAQGGDGGFVVADGADGAGGGGAGGTVFLRAEDSSTFAGTVHARGANGGDVRSSGGLGSLAGPGGGAGGGLVRIEGVDVNGPVDASAGNGGVNLDAGNDPHGALAGTAGVVEGGS